MRLPASKNLLRVTGLIGLTATIAAVPMATDEPFDDYWAWQALEETPLPEVNREAWCRNGIDRFILSRMEGKNLQPAPEASGHGPP